MSVSFHYPAKTSLPNRTRLKAFIPLICKREGKKLRELNIIFCSDDALLQINRDFLKHDYYTDIITFNLGSKHDSDISAEIYISVDRVRDNAGQFQQSVTRELHRVIFHGVLHLCGYADKSKADISLMRKKEDEYLARYFK